MKGKVRWECSEKHWKKWRPKDSLKKQRKQEAVKAMKMEETVAVLKSAEGSCNNCGGDALGLVLV